MCRLEGKVAVGTVAVADIELAPVRRFAGGGVATGVHGKNSNFTDRGLLRLARR